MDRKQGLAGGDEAVSQPTPPEEVNASSPDSTENAKAAPRVKLTGEDVAAKFAERRAARAELKASKPVRPMGTLIRAVAASAMGVGIIATALSMSAAEERHSADVSSNLSKIAALEGAMAALVPAGDENAAANLADGIAAAQKRTDELAAAQQEFSVIAHAGNFEPGTNDGRPKQAVLRSVEHRKALAGFFTPGSMVLTDDQAYSFRTEKLLDPGKIDPRLPWFSRYEPAAGESVAQEASDPAGYVWKRASVTLSGTPGVMSVVWTNTDTKTGELLAWATARYSVEADVFQNLAVHKTTRGEAQQLRVDTVGTKTNNGVGA